jgi:ribosomal protein S12 methylthiotransferase
VKELLVISQDTSAYGVDVKYRTGFWDGKPVKTRMLELVQTLGEMAKPMAPGCACTMSTRTRSVDEVIPLMAEGRCCPTWTCPSSTATPMCSSA